MAEQTLYRNLLWIIEEDVGMIYGPTGSAKSFLMEALVQSAIEEEAKPLPVAFLDTERNFTGETMKWLQKKTDYKYLAGFPEVKEWVRNLRPGKKLVIIDSLGAPVLGAFAQSNLRQRGEMLLGGVDVLYQLKVYCQQHGAMAIITNQPVSEMGAKRDLRTNELLEELNPFGGKWGHSVKEVYRCEKQPSKGLNTLIDIVVYKSRHMAAGHKLAHMTINSAGTTIEFENYEGRRGKGRLPVRIIVKKGAGPDKEEPPEPPKEKKRPRRRATAEKAEKAEKADEAEKAAEADEAEKAEKADEAEKAAKADEAEKAAKADEAEKAAKADEANGNEPDTSKGTDVDAEIVSTLTMLSALAEEKDIPEDKLAALLFSELEVASLDDIKTVEEADAAIALVRKYKGEDSEE